MKKVVFPPLNILVVALASIFVTCTSEEKYCPCVHLKDFVCGWQINQQMKSNCTDNFIYEPCSEGSVDADLMTECPNECFNTKDEDKWATQCGRCLKWDTQECLEPGELSTKKLKFPKDHKKRPNQEIVIDFGTPMDLKTRTRESEFVSCDRDKSKVALEFVLVLDASSSYITHGGGIKSFIQYVQDTMGEIVDSFAAEFPNARFGLTYFSDYNYIAYGSSYDTCYEFLQALTDDKEEIIKAAENIYLKGWGADLIESSLTAILFSAVDRRMGWSKDEYTDGKKVIKVLVVTTDDGWRTSDSSNSRSKPKPKGDGTDTCNTGVPSEELVKEVLLENDFYIGGLLAASTFGTWHNYMKTLSMENRSALEVLAVDAPEKLAKTLVLVLNEILCLNDTKPKTTTEEPGSGSGETTNPDDLYEMWMWNLIAV